MRQTACLTWALKLGATLLIQSFNITLSHALWWHHLFNLAFSAASLNTILDFLPKQRRTGLFSATQTQELEKLVRAGLRNPVRITVKEKGVADSNSQKTPSRLSNYYTVSAQHRLWVWCLCFGQTIRLKRERCLLIVVVCSSEWLSTLASQICRAEDKFNTLVTFLRKHKNEKQLVFFRCVRASG